MCYHIEAVITLCHVRISMYTSTVCVIGRMDCVRMVYVCMYCICMEVCMLRMSVHVCFVFVCMYALCTMCVFFLGLMDLRHELLK
jgi:hypothetical protein